MKPVHTIIAASIILNIALFAYTKPFSPRPRAVSQKIQAPKPSAQNASALNLQTATPEQLMQRLAAMGLPPDVIKALVRQRIERIFHTKRLTLAGMDDPRYWRLPQLSSLSFRAKFAEIMEVQRELDELQEKLLGANYEDPSQTEKLRQKYGGLTEEKLRAIAKIDDEYKKQENVLMQRYAKTGTVTEEDSKQMQSMRKQRREALSGLLTPDELFDYDVRVNSGSLKHDTRLFDITEQQFRDMFAVYQNTRINFDDPAIAFSQLTTASRQEREDSRESQYRQILGDDRYADYLQSKNPAHEKLNLIVHRLDLPISAAREVVSVQDDIRARAVAIDTDATLTNAERAEYYAALAQEARERITQTLGPRGYTAYRENSQNWIQTLESGKTPTRPRETE